MKKTALLIALIFLFPTFAIAQRNICFTRTQALKISGALKRCKLQKKLFALEKVGLKERCEARKKRDLGVVKANRGSWVPYALAGFGAGLAVGGIAVLLVAR